MTVSRYIRSPKKVAKETGERIAKIMEEINYIPNRAPGMLLNAQSYTLGILIPSFQNQSRIVAMSFCEPRRCRTAGLRP
ncbi:LacI family DNA-binding transcriptional regulator, partial [Pseudomonas aeruginosa]|uniref:LacI family DNA-binding transcriptional regulator n=1 Tax=Pseudomonas aeruginosa TaxID=287 RepID=UPI003C6E0738